MTYPHRNCYNDLSTVSVQVCSVLYILPFLSYICLTEELPYYCIYVWFYNLQIHFVIFIYLSLGLIMIDRRIYQDVFSLRLTVHLYGVFVDRGELY